MGKRKHLPDPPQCRIYRLPLLAFLYELILAPRGDPVVLATAAALSKFPPRLDEAESLEPMQNGVQHPVRPLHVPTGHLLYSLDDGVAIAVPFREYRQDYRGRGSGYQVLVEFHDLTRCAVSMRSRVMMHSSNIHNSSMYVKRFLDEHRDLPINESGIPVSVPINEKPSHRPGISMYHLP